MAAYSCAPFVNPTLNSINVNTVLNHNVVDTSIPPPNFSSNNVMFPAHHQSNQLSGQHFNFNPPANISHVSGLNASGSPFPSMPPNMLSQNTQNFDPNAKQSPPVWKSSFQNNALENNAFSGPSHVTGFQLNMAGNVAYQNLPPPQSPENFPAAPPPVWQNSNPLNNFNRKSDNANTSPSQVWQNGNSFNNHNRKSDNVNTSPSIWQSSNSCNNYNRKSDSVNRSHPPVFNQNQTMFQKEMPPPNFESVQTPHNTFPTQYSTPPVWNNSSSNSPNCTTRPVQFNNFEKTPQNMNRDFLKIQKTNVPDMKIFNNPEVVLNMSGNSLISENVNVNSNQFSQSLYTESNNAFNSPRKERVNHNRNFANNNLPFQKWNKEPLNVSPKKEQFESRNTHKPFQFNGVRNRALSQHNHQNLIDIEVLSDNNNHNNKCTENQNISSHAFNTERKNFTFEDSKDFTNYKLFSNISTNSSSHFKEHSLNSFLRPNNTFGGQDNVRNKKSWMSEEIEMALKERNQLFFEAKRTKDPVVWDKYYTLKNQIDEDIRKAKSGSGFKSFNNRSFNNRNNNRRPSDKDLPFSCDMCDRSFSTDAEYKEHCALHIKCDYAGCNFEAHPKIVFLHQKMQHETGYAEAINKLQNDEEIKKWREERKRNFPTAENILKRQAEQAEKEARGEVVKDQNFGRFKRQRTGPGNSRYDRFKQRRDRKFRQRPKNKFSYIRENLEVQYEALKAENSDSEAESESHIKLPRFTGIKKELEPLPSDVTQDTNEDNDVLEIPVSEQTSKSQDLNEDKDIQESLISQQVDIPEDKNEDLDDESPLEIPISKQPLNEVPESYDDYGDNESIVIQGIKKDHDTTITENLANGDSPVKEEENSTPSHDSKDNSKKRRHEKNSIRRQPRPVFPSRRKNSLLGMLLQDEIRHERNVIMQCVRHIVRNKFFGIGSENCNGEV